MYNFVTICVYWQLFVSADVHTRAQGVRAFAKRVNNCVCMCVGFCRSAYDS